MNFQGLRGCARFVLGAQWEIATGADVSDPGLILARGARVDHLEVFAVDQSGPPKAEVSPGEIRCRTPGGAGRTGRSGKDRAFHAIVSRGPGTLPR